MKLSVNIIANLIGRVWVAGIGILLVPQYIKFLGIESYGLVGFYGTLIGALSLLDFGLSLTLNRELTKAIVEKRDADSIRSMVFTLECVYWLIGLVSTVIIIALAPLIATHWLHAKNIPVDTMSHIVMLMGVVAAFQWPISLYNGGLTGIEKQVLDNVIMVAMTTLRSAGVILILWLVSPTISAFFIWQAITSFIYVFSMRAGLWYYLPKGLKRVKLSMQHFTQIWKFAAGVTGIGFVTFFLTQIDKIVLTRLLPLTDFAYYTLAFTVANSLSMFVVPVNIAVFPRLTALVTAKDKAGFVIAYHRGCRIVASIIFPIGLILIVFAKDIMLLWTKDPTTVSHTFSMVQILVAGSVLNSLMVMPYLLMLANGQTRFTIYQNIIASVVLIPLLFWWVHLYGVVGGTFVWLAVNIGYVTISIPLIHRNYLSGELKTWYLKDTFLPLLPPLITVTVLKLALNNYNSGFNIGLPLLFLFSFLTLTSSVVFMPECKVIIKRFKEIFNTNV